MTNEIKKGVTVYISPELTLANQWIQGTVIKVHENPFLGTVISVETADRNVFFGKSSMFRTQQIS